MKTAIKAIGSLVAASALALTLTACGGATPEETTPTTPSISAPVETTPAHTESPAAPPASAYATTRVDADANGVITLPNGEIADCPADAPGALVKADGSYTCEVLLDQEDLDIIWGGEQP